jgi:predicted  nucleic acid-binding Zn-ribbon protein
MTMSDQEMDRIVQKLVPLVDACVKSALDAALKPAIDAALKPAIEAALKPIEARLTAIENRLDPIEARLTAIENRLDPIEARLTALEKENARRQEALYLKGATRYRARNALGDDYHDFRRLVSYSPAPPPYCD